MLREAFWSIVATGALWLVVWAVVSWSKRRDFELGAQACRDGLPLNARWSEAMRAGWSDEYLLRMLTDRRAGQ